MSAALLANRYRPLRPLGEGGMGRVLLVEDTVAGCDRAMKIVKGGEKSALMFQQEFRLMTRLRHPHCCQVFDYGVLDEAEPFLTMEVVPGRTLEESVGPSGRLSREVVGQLLLALDYIHQQGLVHRDLKAENVRVKPDGTVKLMDYGLMEYAGRSGLPVAGTLATMAPEVIKRGPIDQRTDLYSLGCVLYELLAGRPPFQADDVTGLLKAHIQETPRPPSRWRPGVDPFWERLVLKLLAKEPIDRFQSAQAVLAELGLATPEVLGGRLLTSPMRDRDRELARLTEGLAAVAAGRSAVPALVLGPAGMGKSRLLEEFRFAVQLEPVAYAVGPSFEHGTLPYGPFVALVQALLPTLRELVPEALAAVAPVLVRLLPDLGGEAEAVQDSAQDNQRVQEAFLELFAALVARRPLVAVLEDWHWADPLSSELMTVLLERLADAPLQMVLAARQAPEDASWRARTAPITLERLSSEGLGQMIASILGSREVDPAFVAQVAALSEGNPFYVQALLDHLVREGVLTHEAGRWQTRLTIPATQVPRSLASLLQRRLQALSAPGRELACLGAVLEDATAIERLRRLFSGSDEDFFAAIDELSRAGLWTQETDGRYRLADEELPPLLYDGLSADRRAGLHARVLAELEAEPGAARPEDAPLMLAVGLAKHALRAGAEQAAIRYALVAGCRLADLGDGAEAVSYLERGLALLRAQPAPSPHVLGTYLVRLGDAWRSVGQTAPPREAYLEAVALSEAGGPQETLARALLGLAKLALRHSAYPECLSWCDRAEPVLTALGDRAGLARLLLTRARVQVFTGELQAALASGQGAVALGREGHDPRFLALALATTGYLLVSVAPEREAEALPMFDEALALAMPTRDQHIIAEIYEFIGNGSMALTRLEAALDAYEHNMAIARAKQATDSEYGAWLNIALVKLDLGRPAEALAAARTGIEMGERLRIGFMRPLLIAVMAAASAQLGRPDDAGRLLEEAREAAEGRSKYERTYAALYEAETRRLLGQGQAARSAIAPLDAMLTEAGLAELQPRLQALTAEIWLEAGEIEAARAASVRALATARAAHTGAWIARALKVQAALARAEGRPTEALAYASEALRLAEAHQYRPLVAELETLLAALMPSAQAAAPRTARSPSGFLQPLGD